MDNFFFGKNKFSKSESNQEFTEISSNYSRTYSKGKSFKFSIWNEVDTYNNDEFVQDFVQWNQKLWAAKKTSTNIPPTQGEYWELIVEGVSDVEFKQEDNRILWKYEDDLEWKDLFELDSVSEDQIKKMLEDLDIKYRNTYDDTLSLTSTNAVQNQAVTKKFKELDDKNTRTDNELTNIKSSVNTALSNSKSYTDSKISETKIQIDSELNKKANQTNVDETIDELNKNINLKVENIIESTPFEKGDADNSAVLKGEYEGYSNRAISQTSMAVGAATIAGLKGWYYSAIDFTNKTITLSDRPTYILAGNLLLNGGWSSSTPNIKVNDVISLVNNSKYDLCSKVTAVNENVITVDSLPFTGLVRDSGAAAAVLAGQFSDGYSLYIPENPGAGIIDFGGGAFSEGGQSKASNICAHAEGLQTHAYGQYSHAEGRETKAGYIAHAEGSKSEAIGNASHAEGTENIAVNSNTHAEGRYTKATGYAAHAEGYGESLENPNLAQGNYSHVEGEKTKSLGIASHAEGGSSIAKGNFSHSEGRFTRAHALCSHAEGFSVEGREDAYGAFGPISHVEGYANTTTSTANSAHAEGRLNVAKGMCAHVEGLSNVASGEAAHAEGCYTEASGKGSHAEGGYSGAGIAVVTASGDYSHAEGSFTTASGYCSHAEGNSTSARGTHSHAEGFGTETQNSAEHASGCYNISTKSSDAAKRTQFSIGIGTSYTDRKNAFEVKQNGEHYIYGIGGYDGTNSTSSKDLKTIIDNKTEKSETSVINNKINTLNGTGEGSVIKTVKDEISNLVGTAPEKLDTLQEIADYLEEHEDMASGLVKSLSSLEKNKVDKEVGKGLSTEDYTTEEKNKLAGLNNYDDTAITAELSKKADKDGVYSGMTVGRSIDLLGVEDVEEGSFLFRPTDGDGSIKDGVAVVKSVKGDSVVWNQCFGNGATNKDYLKWEGNKATINGEFDADNVSYDIVGGGAKFVAPITNHKYLVEIDVISGTISGGIIAHYLPFVNINMDISENRLSVKTFVTSTITPSYYFARTIKAGVIATNLKVMYRVTDLTKMFGVGNEPSTIEEFNARMATLGVDMNAYNEGEVVNMKASAIKSVGFNAWDEEWEVGRYDVNTGVPMTHTSHIRSKSDKPIKVLPNTEYYIHNGSAIGQSDIGYMSIIFFYDIDDNFIKRTASVANKTFTTPQNCDHIRFYNNTEYGTTYKNDICINLVHSGYRNGEYEPYIEDVLALPTLDLFPNGMNKIGDVYDEYDSEKSVQRIGIRPYQSGDESIENVLTDGTSTFYVLEEPIVTPHDYRLAYKAWDFGTEQVIADGNTTAMTAGIIYEFNARDTIRSNKTRLDVLEPIVAGKIDKEADDYYPQLAVGLADNLAGVDVVDSEVNFRRSGGGAINDGVARIEAIKGNSVVWNQRFAPRNYTINGITTTYQDGKYHSVGQLTSTYFNINQFDANELNHKYLFIASGFSSSFSGKFALLNRNANTIITNGFAYILHNNTDPSLNRYIGFSNMTEGDEIDETYTLVQYDLTKMFGAGNEPTTIEEFYSRIPMGVDLNAYNEGEVIHMDVQSVESVGVNQWDEEWELGGYVPDGKPNNDTTRIRTKNPIRVIPNTTYKVTSSKTLGFRFYDSKGVHLGIDTNLTTINDYIQTPTNAYYMRFSVVDTSTYNHDICINISDTSINGKYFPYIKRVEDLSIIRKYFPNGMKSAGTAHDEIRYNKQTNKWEKVVKISSVDLGTLNWYYYADYGFSASLTNEAMWHTANFLSALPYDKKVTPTIVELKQLDKVMMFGVPNIADSWAKRVVIKDSVYTDTASFTAAMQGVMLYYELAEPIVTELDAEDQFKDLDYQVWNCGTEKAIAEGISAPLAADITYGFNAVGKIREHELEITELQSGVSTQKTTITSNSNEIAALKTLVASLQTQIEQLRTSITAVNDKVTEITVTE